MNGRSPSYFVAVVFAGILLSAGSFQLGIELGRREKPQMLELFTQRPTVVHLRAYEQNLEEASWLAMRLRPRMQYWQFLLFQNPGEKALIGPAGWWFYQPGVKYLTQRQPVPAEGGQSDPVIAICDFRDQLVARGIHLLMVPVPNKESVYPGQLSCRAKDLPVAVCDQTRSLLRRLRAAEVDVVDLFEFYARVKTETIDAVAPSLYLTRDSHWSPEGLERAAQAVAEHLQDRGWINPGGIDYQTRSAPVQRVGDLVRMLNVPQIESRLPAELVPCEQVLHSGTQAIYQDDPQSKILVLGDSFLRIFEQDEPGAAGFIAHLARHLRQPVASIINDGGASTLVRQDLYRRPALLENKTVVVWEFVERDIWFGTEGWQSVPLPTQ